MRFCAAVSFVVLLASVVAAQDPAQKPPVEKEEPDFAFLGNSPYLEQKGQVQFINVLRFDTRRGRPNQKFSNAFNRMEFGLTDRWEFDAISKALKRELPILAICRGIQVLNVALGGTLKLDIPGHRLPEQKEQDIQRLRYDGKAKHRFENVNSSHHQAIDRVADGFEVEAWCAHDDIIEQVRLRDYPFALAVQYHPERGKIYDALFEDFFQRVKTIKR